MSNERGDADMTLKTQFTRRDRVLFLAWLARATVDGNEACRQFALGLNLEYDHFERMVDQLFGEKLIDRIWEGVRGGKKQTLIRVWILPMGRAQLKAGLERLDLTTQEAAAEVQARIDGVEEEERVVAQPAAIKVSVTVPQGQKGTGGSPKDQSTAASGAGERMQGLRTANAELQSQLDELRAELARARSNHTQELGQAEAALTAERAERHASLTEAGRAKQQETDAEVIRLQGEVQRLTQLLAGGREGARTAAARRLEEAERDARAVGAAEANLNAARIEQGQLRREVEKLRTQLAENGVRAEELAVARRLSGRLEAQTLELQAQLRASIDRVAELEALSTRYETDVQEALQLATASDEVVNELRAQLTEVGTGDSEAKLRAELATVQAEFVAFRTQSLVQIAELEGQLLEARAVVEAASTQVVSPAATQDSEVARLTKALATAKAELRRVRSRLTKQSAELERLLATLGPDMAINPLMNRWAVKDSTVTLELLRCLADSGPEVSTAGTVEDKVAKLLEITPEEARVLIISLYLRGLAELDIAIYWLGITQTGHNRVTGAKEGGRPKKNGRPALKRVV